MPTILSTMIANNDFVIKIDFREKLVFKCASCDKPGTNTFTCIKQVY